MNDIPREDPPSETDADVDERVREAKRVRLQLTADSRELVDEIAALLYRSDPADIAFGTNRNEYEAEAEVIVIGLEATTGVEDVAELAQQVFAVWFDTETAGPVSRYEGVAAEIWDAWRRHQGATEGGS